MAKTIKFFSVSEDVGRMINIKRDSSAQTVESRTATVQISEQTHSIHIGWETDGADFKLHAEFSQLVLGEIRNDRLELVLTGVIDEEKAKIAWTNWCESWIKESTFPEQGNTIDVDIPLRVYRTAPVATINFYENKPTQ